MSDPLAPTIRAHERAIALREAGDFASAERACRRALAGYRAVEGERHPDVANALVELGLILEARDRLEEAAVCHERALGMIARSRDPDVIRLAVRARIALAGIARIRGAYADAERGYQRAIAQVRRAFGARDAYVGSLYNNLGVLRKAQGRYAEAVAFYRRAAKWVSARDRESQATLAHNLGGIEHARGRYAVAEPHARRSVRLRRALHGDGHPAVAADVAALAAIVEGRGRLAEAAGLYRRALAVFQRKLGPRSLEVGLNLASLAAVEQRRGRLAPARALYQRALAIKEPLLGLDHPDVAMTVNNLAVLEREAGDLARARALFRRAQLSFRRRLGEHHPHTLLATQNLHAAGVTKRNKPSRVSARKALKKHAATRR
jgi:tetratricopeptide (TPR) repeat protein